MSDKDQDAAEEVAGRRSRKSNLTERLVQTFTSRIMSGKYQPGDRLPTEQQLVERNGVSRTVVREAIAALRADGLLVTQQGRGAFVADHPPVARFDIDLSELNSVRQVISMMELRIGVEVEAVSLSAQRRSKEGLARLVERHAEFEAAVEARNLAADEDFRFHVAIAEAADSPQFQRFFNMLGKVVIPRQSIQSGERSDAERHAYLKEVGHQHARIVEAIAAQDPVSAQAAMRSHLTNSLNRYRKFEAHMEQDGVGAEKAENKGSDEHENH